MESKPTNIIQYIWTPDNIILLWWKRKVYNNAMTKTHAQSHAVSCWTISIPSFFMLPCFHSLAVSLDFCPFLILYWRSIVLQFPTFSIRLRSKQKHIHVIYNIHIYVKCTYEENQNIMPKKRSKSKWKINHAIWTQSIISIDSKSQNPIDSCPSSMFTLVSYIHTNLHIHNVVIFRKAVVVHIAFIVIQYTVDNSMDREIEVER